jgi:hypothetical protein
VDQQKLAGVSTLLLMAQSMIDFDLPEKDFQVLAYQPLAD